MHKENLDIHQQSKCWELHFQCCRGTIMADSAPHLRDIAVKVLVLGCENWSTFSPIHTKLWNRLALGKLEWLVYAHYHMRLKIWNLRYKASEFEYYSPIDLNHIFDDDDILDLWIREQEEPILSNLVAKVKL